MVIGKRRLVGARKGGKWKKRENFSGEKGDKFGMHWVKVEWGALE